MTQAKRLGFFLVPSPSVLHLLGTSLGPGTDDIFGAQANTVM